jgi:alpha-tubulin suppressor-like RCC1 family protein
MPSDAAVHCWGAETLGKLGTGGSGIAAQPVRVNGPGFSTVSAAIDHSCGVTSGGQVYCWGYRASSALGAPAGGWSASPAAVGGSTAFRAIATARTHSCALSTGDDAYCWGTDFVGALGTGTPIGTFGTPTAVAGGHRFRSLDTRQAHTCGIETATDRVMCWGRGLNGELGDGSTTDSPTPRFIAGGDAFTYVAVGLEHTCGVRSDGVGLCWGSGTAHQLGNGVLADAATPTPVASAARF